MEEKARELNTLPVVPPSNRISSGVLTWFNIARCFKRLFKYPSIPINKVCCAKHSKWCLHRFLNERHLIVYW